MATLPKPGEIVAALQEAASNSINRDITTVGGFVKDQLERIEALGLKLIDMIAAGEFEDDPEEIEVFTGILKDLVTNFTNTLRGLTVVLIEKVWNAVVDALWGAIEKAAGIPLPRP